MSEFDPKKEIFTSDGENNYEDAEKIKDADLQIEIEETQENTQELDSHIAHEEESEELSDDSSCDNSQMSTEEDYNQDVYEYDSDMGESDNEEEYDDLEQENEEKPSGLKLYIAQKIYSFNSLKKKQKVTYSTIFVVLLILIILIMTDIIPILPNSFHRSYVGNEYTLGETIGSDVEKCGKHVVYASNGSVIFFGPDMEAEKKISTFQGNAQIYTNDDKCIVYSQNGNNALVMKDINDYKTIKVDENIYSAKINSDGDYILLTSEAGYKSCLRAYDSSHELIYEWHTNSNVLDVTLSDDESSIVASTVEYTDSVINTKLVFMETSSTTPVAEVVLENAVISEVFCTPDNIVVAIGDNAAYGYTLSGIEKWVISYEGKNLKTYDYDREGILAFLFNKYKSELSESTVELYDFSGDREGVYESKNNVRSLSVNNGYCLLLLDKGTILIDDDADEKKVKELKEDYQSVVLYDNYNFAFGIKDNISTILSVKH